MDNNNRNTILAIVLSMMVVLGWTVLIDLPRKVETEKRRAEQAQTTESGVLAPQDGGVGNNVPGVQTDPQTGTQPGTNVGVQTSPGAANVPGTEIQVETGQSREAVLATSPRVRIETPSLIGSINLTGGKIDDLLLTKYRETIDPDSPLIKLYSPLGSEHPYYAQIGWTGAADIATPKPTTLWSADGDMLTPANPVTLSWDNGEGLIFKRIISIDDDYRIGIAQSVENNTGKPVTLYPYGLINRIGQPKVTGFFILHEGLIGAFGEDQFEELDYGDLDDADLSANGSREIKPDGGTVTSGWLGITDKYWASALIPSGDTAFSPRFFRGGTDDKPQYQADYLGSAGVTIPAAGTGEHKLILFAGAKEVHVINRYEEQDKIDRFNLMIDWGYFYFLTKPLFFAIDWLFQFLGNFGLAILAITVGVKAFFFPLANRSYTSMSKMKKVQPEVKKLQERHKDDQMALRTEMMELYKKEKINPLSGCWPIMIQIPVFFALYKVLLITIEMRHAPFFGWIQDLSAPDPTSLFNLFGLLPYDVPSFLLVGVWPLLMGITMFVQMQMNPQPPDKTQAMIFAWMPIIFTFMLASFPAGLVIYWAWNNFLSILQQGLIMRRHGVKIELFDNLKGMIGKAGKDPAE